MAHKHRQPQPAPAFGYACRVVACGGNIVPRPWRAREWKCAKCGLLYERPSGVRLRAAAKLAMLWNHIRRRHVVWK